MAFTRKDKDGVGVLEISGTLSIQEATPLHKELVKCLDSCDGVLLDLTETEGCDTAGIQLLCSARKSFEKEGNSFAIEHPPDTIKQYIISAGLNPDEILTDK